MADTATMETLKERAVRLLEEALDDARDDTDAIPAVTEALTCLYLEMGERPEVVRLDADTYADDLKDEDSDEGCTCAPGLVERGGWRGSCPVHGGWHGG